MNSIAIVGASLAGLNAAETLRREGFAGRLVVFGDEPHFPYDRPPLSKEIARGDWPPEKAALPIDALLDDAEWKLGCAVTGLDAASRTLTYGEGQSESFDGIVIATGAAPRRLPGTYIKGVHVVRTLDDAIALRDDLARPGCRVVVVGAGFVGQEAAASARKLDLSVTMIEAVAPAAHVLGAEIGGIIGDMHRRHGVDVRLGVAAAAFEGVERLERVHLSDGSVVAADVAILGIGVTPNTGWLEGSGLTIDNGLVCDETCLAAPGIVAAGDIARWPNRRYGELRRVEHWDNAVRQAEHAAKRLLADGGGLNPGPYMPVPWFWSDQYGLKMQLVGSPVAHDEVRIVFGSGEEERFVALYRRADRLVAALGLAATGKLLKFRRMLENDPSWEEALAAV
ncbi:p-cumate 2,3-dioxygenase system, ferredoxin--NAD(+) reductase component [Brevundimonas sp. NIBR10]|uniref:NAD(P)/FAD-dependent oxidoreductase n=1 Tax=Brevundimonas sp. NIBR10 TaxID=3015997 RepID=UPI0022F1DDA6|nr:FAD-dependent oxidoreductase [Brevundimonas sp. NIBR10]WGM47495.1 p-cumate 2,3-dioxygenase system, ferredoxin--NAD(+) reductase component [Brevundimonas sp. NIBR10]